MRSIVRACMLLMLVALFVHLGPLPSCNKIAYGAEPPPAIVIPNLNASGDFAYLYHLGFAGGIGTDIVSFKDGFVTLRGQVLWAVDTTEREKSNAVIGAGLMIDIIKVVTKAQGQWQLGPIKPKLGPFAGYDFGNQRMDWGVVLQMLKIEF